MGAACVTPLMLGLKIAQVLLHPAWHDGEWGSPSELKRSGGTADMPEELHDLRKAIRDLRYTAEALSPTAGASLGEFIGTMNSF